MLGPTDPTADARRTIVIVCEAMQQLDSCFAEGIPGISHLAIPVIEIGDRANALLTALSTSPLLVLPEPEAVPAPDLEFITVGDTQAVLADVLQTVRQIDTYLASIGRTVDQWQAEILPCEHARQLHADALQFREWAAWWSDLLATGYHRASRKYPVEGT